MRTTRGLAALLTCLLLSASACTGEDDSTTHQARPPRAVALYSGRIAYPHLTLTTWSTCAFEIELVRRVSGSTIWVYGRESSTRCGPRVERRVATTRLTARHLRGGETIERVLVVSREPPYVVPAVVRPRLA